MGVAPTKILSIVILSFEVMLVSEFTKYFILFIYLALQHALQK